MSKRVSSALHEVNRSALHLWGFMVAWLLAMIGFAGCCKTPAMKYGPVPLYGPMPLYGVTPVEYNENPAEYPAADSVVPDAQS